MCFQPADATGDLSQLASGIWELADSLTLRRRSELVCLTQQGKANAGCPVLRELWPDKKWLFLLIEREIKDFSRTSRDVRTSIVVGGTNISEQRGELRNGVEIVIATSGRFLDHLQ